MNDPDIKKIRFRNMLTAAIIGIGAVCIVLLGRGVFFSARSHPGLESSFERNNALVSKFDWDNILLPPGATVFNRLERGKGSANHRLQLLGSSNLAAQRIIVFYETELAKTGWKKYNGNLPVTLGVTGRMFRLGNLSLALHVFEGKNGSDFRLSIVMVPLAKAQ